LVERSDKGSVRMAFESGYFMCGNDVFGLPLGSTEKLIYIALTRYAGSNNRAWPKYETLAKDASCSKRRAVYAIEELCKCRLITKETRGNRSNVYVVYPPKFYCAVETDNKDQEIKQGAQNAPQNDEVSPLYQNQGEKSAPSKKSRVQNLHPEGATPAPQDCSPCTLRVQEVHPNINKNSNRNINTSQTEQDDERETSSNNKTETKTKDIETINKAFKAKQATVREDVITSLLDIYPVQDVKAAIQGTNFEEARNPIAVIKWMLKEGCYVMPVETENIHKPLEYEEPPEVDDEEVRKMFAQAKQELMQKTTKVNVL